MVADFQLLVAGLALFAFFHILAGITEARQKLIAIFGPMGYRAFQSLIATLALVLIVLGYMDAPLEAVYDPPAWGRLAPVVLMPFALIFLAGSSPLFSLKRYHRHPMLLGIFLFGAAHLVANGDRASVYLFGTFGVYALVAMWLGDRKQKMADPEAYATLAARTSLIPFLAVLQGRAEPDNLPRTLKAIVIGFLLYGLLVFAHPHFTGVTVIAT